MGAPRSSPLLRRRHKFDVNHLVVARLVEIGDVCDFLVATLFVEPPCRRVFTAARRLDDDAASMQGADALLSEFKQPPADAVTLGTWIDGNPVDIVNGIRDRVMTVADIPDD